MDINQLRTALNAINVTPPDEYRASLYLTQIQATRTFLFTTLAADPVIGGNNYARFQTALQDPELLSEFCKIIDDFLGPGVSAALQHPVNPYTTYADYFDQNIFNANNATYNANVQNFYAAYPATQRAVQTLTANFQNNIRTACQRIQNNWNDLNTTFTSSNETLGYLSKIESTGSDFHKGGQQVLILSFQLNIAITQNISLSNPFSNIRKVVYKPSDLEADCLIAGDSAAVNAVHPNFQQQSLFEIINGVIQLQLPNIPRLRPLPTYKILPYDWGSNLVANAAGVLPIRRSYGYIEFLEHLHASGTNIFDYYPFGASDFKIFPNQEAVTISRQVYQQIGELLAVAATFSITDLHIENLIISRYQAKLIDMEISLTEPINNLGATSLFGGGLSPGGITGITAPEQTGWDVHGHNGGLYLQPRTAHKEKQNRLWTMQPNQIVNPSASANANALITGFHDGLQILTTAVSNPPPAGNLFNNWFIRLNNVVVRYLPYSTTVLGAAMRGIYDEAHAANQNYYQTLILNFLTAEYWDYTANQTPEPKFIAVQRNYVEDDYLNCDIPVFYHRIGTQGIMNSAGTPIAIPANITVNNQATPPAPVQVQVAGPLGRNTYFAHLPTQVTVQANQVNGLGAPHGLANRYGALRPSLLQGLGLAVLPPINNVIH